MYIRRNEFTAGAFRPRPAADSLWEYRVPKKRETPGPNDGPGETNQRVSAVKADNDRGHPSNTLGNRRLGLVLDQLDMSVQKEDV